MKKFVLGLTGGIASGKSAVTEICRELGAVVVDADIISREVIEEPEIIAAIAEAFPGTVCGGRLDRKKLRKEAFSISGNAEKLNNITHPEIIRVCRERISVSSGFVLFTVPLLFETGLDGLCDMTVTVTCNRDTRIKRLIARDNIDETAAKNIIARQMSDEQREKKADIVIRNDGTLEELKSRVIRLIKKLNFVE